MNKQIAIDSIKNMPQDFELEELIERLLVIEKIEQGRHDVENRKTFSHEQAKGKLSKWVK